MPLSAFCIFWADWIVFCLKVQVIEKDHPEDKKVSVRVQHKLDTTPAGVRLRDEVQTQADFERGL